MTMKIYMSSILVLNIVFVSAFSQGSPSMGHTQGNKNGFSTSSEKLLLLDHQKGKSLVVTLPDRRLMVRIGDDIQNLDVVALSAKFLDSGEVLFIDNSLSLKKIGLEGIVEILPSGSVNAPLFVSNNQQQVAYLKPKDFHGEGRVPLSNGIAVLDMISGKEQILLEIPDITVRLYGWLTLDKLAVEVPYWFPETSEPSDQMILGILHVVNRGSSNSGAVSPDILTSLPAVASGSLYPQTSFDQKYITYDSEQGAVVAELKSSTYSLASGVRDPRWADTGLTFMRGSERVKAT